MKNYYSNEKLVQAFATYQTKEGKANSMFFNENTIYSYGRHFPIATRTGGIYTFFNLNGYSNTTAKHKLLVWRALKNENLIYCKFVPTWDQLERNTINLEFHNKNLNYWNIEIENLLFDLKNPRIKNKQIRLDQIESLKSNMSNYKKYFNL